MNQNLFSILVSNHFGVLMRVTTIFSRRTCNIKSLTVAETQDPKVSRITILFEAEPMMARQIYRLLEKQEDVIAVDFLSLNTPVSRELILVKVGETEGLADELATLATGSHAQVISQNESASIVEFVGTPEQCDAFVKQMEGRTLIEVCRTGAAALGEDTSASER